LINISFKSDVDVYLKEQRLVKLDFRIKTIQESLVLASTLCRI